MDRLESSEGIIGYSSKNLILFQLWDDDDDLNDKFAILSPVIRLEALEIGPDDKVDMIGWGPVDFRKPNSMAIKIQRLQLKTISNEECRKKIMSEKIKDFHMCAVSENGSFGEVSTSTQNSS